MTIGEVTLSWNVIASFGLLLIFAELAAANFKRLAPILEALEQKRKGPESGGGGIGEVLEVIVWKGGWEKLAVFSWAVGSALPCILFSLAALFFIPSKPVAGDLIVGATIGSNVLALSLSFGIFLLRGPLSFFRIRTMTSPIFLLLATVAFSLLCLDERLHRSEGLVLVLLGLAYAFYFRRFSSEWKSYEKTGPTSRTLLDASEGYLPVLAIFCLGLGFAVLGILFSYPLVRWLYASPLSSSYSEAAVHIVAPLLSLPIVIRAVYYTRLTDTAKALSLTGITHSCLLNTLFLTGAIALINPLPVAANILRVDLAVLLCLTAVFVATLLIEKQRDRGLSWILIATFLAYTGLGILF